MEFDDSVDNIDSVDESTEAEDLCDSPDDLDFDESDTWSLSEDATEAWEDIPETTTPGDLPFPEEELAEALDWEQDTLAEQADTPDPALMEALGKAASERDWIEVEQVDSYRHPEFETQMSFQVDPTTGKAMQDEFGEWIQCSRNTPGAQRPDLFMEDEDGIHMREDKCYHDVTSLTQNIRQQTEDRRAAFGDDVDLTYVVSPNFTVVEAERLQNYCENRLGVNLEWQLK